MTRHPLDGNAIAADAHYDPQTPVRGQFVTLTADDQTLTAKGLV